MTSSLSLTMGLPTAPHAGGTDMVSEVSRDPVGTAPEANEFEERNRKLREENERLRSIIGPRVTY